MILTGGTLRHETLAMVGPLAEKALETVHVDKAFVAINGLDPVIGLTTPNMLEASTKRAFFRSTKQVILLMDHSKYGRVFFAKPALTEIDQLLTDGNGISDNALKELDTAGITVTIVQTGREEVMKPVLTITMNPALDKTVTVEDFVLGGLNRIKEWRMDAGGKGINVAKVLKNFSVDVTAWGLCAGRQGNVLTDTLSSLGIPNWFVQAKGETRTNLKVYVEQTRETTELNEPGFTVDDDVLSQFLDRSEPMFVMYR